MFIICLSTWFWYKLTQAFKSPLSILLLEFTLYPIVVIIVIHFVGQKTKMETFIWKNNKKKKIFFFTVKIPLQCIKKGKKMINNIQTCNRFKKKLKAFSPQQQQQQRFSIIIFVLTPFMAFKINRYFALTPKEKRIIIEEKIMQRKNCTKKKNDSIIIMVMNLTSFHFHIYP